MHHDTTATEPLPTGSINRFRGGVANSSTLKWIGMIRGCWRYYTMIFLLKTCSCCSFSRLKELIFWYRHEKNHISSACYHPQESDSCSPNLADDIFAGRTQLFPFAPRWEAIYWLSKMRQTLRPIALTFEKAPDYQEDSSYDETCWCCFYLHQNYTQTAFQDAPEQQPRW
jgi:hypothetical protein